MEDTTHTVYRKQLDHLVLEAIVDVSDHGLSLTAPMKCKISLHLDDGQGLETDLSRGQIVQILKFFQAIWVEVGGLGKLAPPDWQDVR